MQRNPKKRRLVAVVVTHNRLPQLQVTINRLLENPEADLQRVVVVDNACTDGSGTWLANQTDPRLCVLHSATNTGGAGGFETGMRYAMTHFNPDWLLLMDDDGRPYGDTLAAFHGQDRTICDAVATAVYTPHGTICDINRPSLNPFWNRRVFLETLLGRGRDGFHLGPQDYESVSPQDIDGASFVGLFVSRRAVELIGYPDGDLFIYGDDILYTLTLRAAGGRMIFDPALKFEHDYRTRTDGDRRFRPLWKIYYHHRNLLLVYRQAAGLWFWPALLLILPKWALKLRDYKGERRAFLRLMRHAILDGLTRRLKRPHDTIIEWSLTRASEVDQISVETPQKQEPEEQKAQPDKDDICLADVVRVVGRENPGAHQSGDVHERVEP